MLPGDLRLRRGRRAGRVELAGILGYKLRSATNCARNPSTQSIDTNTDNPRTPGEDNDQQFQSR